MKTKNDLSCRGPVTPAVSRAGTLHRWLAIFFVSLFCCSARAADSGVTLQNFKLTGDLGGDVATFTLTANAKVENSRGAVLELLSGPVALTGIGPHAKWDVQSQDGRFFLAFDRGGTFPIQIKF